MNRSLIRLFGLGLVLIANSAHGDVKFVEATTDVGLPLMNSARLTFVDLNGDGRADVVARAKPQSGRSDDSYRAFLNRPEKSAKYGFRYEEIENPNLPTPIGGDVITFADIDNDGLPDAIFTRYLDTKHAHYIAPTTQPTGTSWIKGNGDGTFGTPQAIEQATPATAACIAVGDANCDGLPDILLGNWYDQYGAAHTAYPSDLLIQRREGSDSIRFERTKLPCDGIAWDFDDRGPRPTYGVMFVRLEDSPIPSILMLNYGRRANRLYVPTDGANLKYEDRGVAMKVDGDEIRHGKYPQWLREVGKSDPRFDRADEPAFRGHGNTFDAALGDVNGDGKFDLFLSEITHAWAGESSDRSRFLLRDGDAFRYDQRLSVDREGTGPTTNPTQKQSWNQGDIFASLADLDHDGRLDLILCSSDYPDRPPHENRLRIYRQKEDGCFEDVTAASSIDHVGAQQPSLADLDGDGDLDLLVGQSFNRFTRAMIEERTPPGPVGRIFLNQTNRPSSSIMLKLIGDPSRGVTRSALNAIVRMTTIVNGQRVTQVRQLIGPGGHNGKIVDAGGIVHFGLGDASEADEVRIEWSGLNVDPTVLRNVKPGLHTVSLFGR